MKVLNRKMLISLTLVLSIGLAGCSREEKPESLAHIHGLSYSNDGKEVWIPAHYGIIVYREGNWSYAPGDNHDYMGFSMADDGFYSSGHPAPQSDLPNPLGIVKSNDNGKTIETLALGGVEDFHGLAVGYRTHSLFVFNSKPNNLMSAPGFYSSTDEGKTWNSAAMKGVSGQPTVMAVHPEEPNTVSIGTNEGVFVSQDLGNNFEKLTLEGDVSALSYDVEGSLIVGTVDGKLQKQTGEQWTEIAIPEKSEDDIVTNIVQSPTNANEWVAATGQLNLWTSNDEGVTWKLIVKEGKLK